MLAAVLLAGATAVSAAEGGALSQLKAQAGSAGTSVSVPAVPPAKTTWTVPREVLGVREGGILIVGGPDFVAATKKALALIARSRMHAAVVAAIGRIEQAPCSGMDVHARVPTFHVGERTWQGNPLWYASAIVHDSRHSQLYSEAKQEMGGLEPPPWQWQEVEGERKGLAYQLKFLTEMKAPRTTLDYVKALEADPRYQNIGREGRTITPWDPLQTPPSGMACHGRYW